MLSEQQHMEQSEKKLVVLGAGESGVGAAVLAKQKGYDVFVSDSGLIAEDYKQQLIDLNIEFEEGSHTEGRVLNADIIVKSPGIPQKAAIVKKVREKGIEVLSEIEFAARYTLAKLICITGSNGKSTTATLTWFILQKAGLNVGLAGNIGKSFALQVANESFDYYVLEISSFMLDDMTQLKADFAVLLNITPDHLDRYDYKMENYVESKFKIIQNQREDDFFIYDIDDEEILNGLRKYKSKATYIPFSQQKILSEGAFLDENSTIIIKVTNQPTFAMSINELALQGKHNVYNNMASGIVAKVLELRNESIRESMGEYQNIAHRLEHVAQIAGINFINDSKATNVNSVWYALESMPANVVLIMGGVDKGNDYNILKDLIHSKVSAIVCIGKDNARIHEAFDDETDVIVNTSSMKEAVTLAYHLAKKGDTVLLSPACASFDLFKNYEDRGDQFKAAVREL
ncbi:UDP-N-acetylmuramoyl-L-alanine--D-glutamate ligase [Albibacterium bauzanense]|uniref:UDP-N-acetylmuramoylalanine--D-glutamate ligase n=1 Tax=Albibacterium bauzanense TaxID=653929 RepID=A0A4R1M1M1_9SPHI|nr:UDP-N-acetylmuramoyl-L-alanine--D-glutamate ligase [Albibacterium bauzanense]TCK83523.1 UDP-N-acetylmuramoylalanine--D-glutamate ligase [Albibacterium bauzanense]